MGDLIVHAIKYSSIAIRELLQLISIVSLDKRKVMIPTYITHKILCQ